MTIITLTGPTCSGKSTLEKMLVREPGFARVVSHTTRPMRSGEENGREYFFVDAEEFTRLEQAGEFVELVEFGGNRYGATKTQFLDIIGRGYHAVVVVEPNGRDEIIHFAEEQGIPIMPVFVTNPTDVLAKRFLERMLADFSVSLTTTGSAEKVLHTYAGRLDMMLSEERNWTTAAHPFGIAFGKFDQTNDKAVLNRIMRGVEALKTVS